MGAGLPHSDNELIYWRPQGDSNPCYRRERAMSWASRRWGRGRARERAARGAEEYTPSPKGTMSAAKRQPRIFRGCRLLQISELVRRPDVPEGARQVVRARIVSIQRAGVADRRTYTEQIVHTEIDLEAL